MHRHEIGKLDVLIIAVSANAILFVIVGLLLGGSADIGEASNNEFFLGQGTSLTKTSHFVYAYSLWHGRITAASVLVTLLIGLIDHFRRRSKYKKEKEEREKKKRYTHKKKRRKGAPIRKSEKEDEIRHP